MQRVVIRNGRSPFEFALVSVSATAGLLGLTLRDPGPSTNIARVFGPWAPWFYLLLFISAVITLAGPWVPRTNIHNLALSMRIERIGLLPLGGASMAYGIANLVITGKPALIAALLVGGIGAAAWVRARIITNDLKKLDLLLDIQLPPPDKTPS